MILASENVTAGRVTGLSPNNNSHFPVCVFLPALFLDVAERDQGKPSHLLQASGLLLLWMSQSFQVAGSPTGSDGESLAVTLRNGT